MKRTLQVALTVAFLSAPLGAHAQALMQPPAVPDTMLLAAQTVLAAQYWRARALQDEAQIAELTHEVAADKSKPSVQKPVTAAVGADSAKSVSHP